ncbi:ABC transporter permease/M1 family aminopeptidase [Sphingobacterium detergens]|uniref:ABC transporter permease/M1 family aminopeptidase n=1 Tax=Sphingobacterium detergens TaxID=1145106 RepID=UPI000E7559DA|nr:M1 family aminopeptidase [Sphingobacterium detergens]
MKSILRFSLLRGLKGWPTYLFLALIVLIAAFCGNQFNMSISQDIYTNAAYTIGFVLGFFSLSIIFFACYFAQKILFSDAESGFGQIVFATPIHKKAYLAGNFTAHFLLSLMCFVLVCLGFGIGLNLRTGVDMQPVFSWGYYLYPLFVFGVFNSLFVCSLLFTLSYLSKSKLTVLLGAIALYIAYMLLLLFSSSPFMSGSMPQSIGMQKISSLLDPFGISAYFYEAQARSVDAKNLALQPFSGFLLINRLLYLGLAVGCCLIGYDRFSFASASIRRKVKQPLTQAAPERQSMPYKKIAAVFHWEARVQATLSFVKIDLSYLSRGIACYGISMCLLFAIGMEMYAEIEKGIRIPQKYASSGLLSAAIIENFQLLGMLIILYLTNDLYWRSWVSGFSRLEMTTYYNRNKSLGHGLSLIVVILFFTVLLVLEAIVFQFAYGYLQFDWAAYAGVLSFTSLSLILFALIILFINSTTANRFTALGISLLVFLFLGTFFVKKILPNPLFHFFLPYEEGYSDFSGYSAYLTAYLLRTVFGLSLIGLCYALASLGFRNRRLIKISAASACLLASVLLAWMYSKEQHFQSKKAGYLAAATYEKLYRSYDQMVLPKIVRLTTEVSLYPSQQHYRIQGSYLLKNEGQGPMDTVLINFHPTLKLLQSALIMGGDTIQVNTANPLVLLPKSLSPGDTMLFNFDLSYNWYGVNAHDPFNVIMNGGSFMRISRYYPQLGYQQDAELTDPNLRKEYGLGVGRKENPLVGPEVQKNDFIDLEMKVSTQADQAVVASADLVKDWREKGRHFYQFSAQQIPFRFALSSASYQIKTCYHRGIAISVYYHPKHSENVEHLLKNAKLSLDYCIDQFGPYPFRSLVLAEIAGYTKGFAGTAYPAAVFMPENMVFHANLHADKHQDVINEIAGHEVSHLWWGNSQIDPDDRQGKLMLTESLAMYTEMMLYKKMYGQSGLQRQLELHAQIYASAKGLQVPEPLYMVSAGNTHTAYSKGALVFVKIADLLGEVELNRALKAFLIANKYPKKPTSLDLIEEIRSVCKNEGQFRKIENLLKEAESL